MTTSELKSRGRPAREWIEVARTASWYARVRAVSGLSEYRLEATFDERDHASRGRHKGTRWNKYKFGRASPGRSLLLWVEATFPGALCFYDHPVWTLARQASIDSGELRRLVEELPPQVAALFLDPSSPPSSAFWMRQDFSYRAAIGSLMDLAQAEGADHFAAVSGLLVVIHDGRNRQQEDQHFDAHLALAAYAVRAYESSAKAKAEAKGKGELPAHLWRLETFVLESWLSTEYRSDSKRETVESLRDLGVGPTAPWMPSQIRLPFRRTEAIRSAEEALEIRAYRAALELAKQSPQEWCE